MIEENEFLERTWIEFAVAAELQRDLCHAVRFARSVDAKGVGFALGHADRGVLDWCQEKKDGSYDQEQKRQTGGIGNPAHAPVRAPAPDRAIEGDSQDRESKEEKDPEINDELYAVIQNVVTHLVGHDFANLRERALLEQVVVQGDAGGAQKARDVCTDAV